MGCAYIPEGSPEFRKSFVGAPIAVQIVGRKGEDDALCSAMQTIDNVIRGKDAGVSKL